MGRTDDGLDHMRRAWRNAWVLRVALACIAATTILITFLIWLVPDASHQSRGRTILDFLYVVVGFVIVASITVAVIDRRRWRRVVAWMAGDAEGADTTDSSGRDIVLRLAWRHGVESLAVWLVGSLAFALADLAIGDDPGRSALLLGGAVLGGMSISVSTYLGCDVILRPAVATVLAREPMRAGSAPGVRSRLLAVWMSSAGIPLAGVALAMVWHRVFDTNMNGPIVAIVVAGLASGVILQTAVSRSVAEPVERVRRALGRVQSDDLSADVDLVVDDTSELGSLAQGFNQMVVSLRERKLVEDLFGRHVGPDVARRALENGVDFAGQQMDATVMMVDLIGSTSLIEREHAARTLGVINAMFTAVEGAVEAEGGWITQFQGDAALVVFGVPTHRDDHAHRALRAASALWRELCALSRDMPDLDVGIGIASGTVVAGHIGAQTRVSYNVVGDPANVAARLCDLAKHVPFRMLADSSTVESAGTGEWVLHDVVSLRGRLRPTTCYRPVALDDLSVDGRSVDGASVDGRRWRDVQRRIREVAVDQRRQ